MSQIQVTARIRIQDGKLERFKAMGKECRDLVRANEKGKGCLQYDWFVTADGNEAVVRETYRDSEAFLIHLQNVGAQLAQMGEVGEMTAELCGSPTDQVKEAIAALDVTYYEPLGGI